MMKSKRTILILVVVLASLLMVAAVSADTVAGEGWINAQGRGRAAVQGDVGVLRISGRGSLWYKDEGELDEPVITGRGKCIEYPKSGWVQCVGFNGEASISDADQFTIALIGKNIHLFASGEGRVYLKGRGSYQVGRGPDVVDGTWSETGEYLTLESGEALE